MNRWAEIQDSDGDLLVDVYRARARAFHGPEAFQIMVASAAIFLLPDWKWLAFVMYVAIGVALSLVPRVNGSRLVALTTGRVLVLRRTWRDRSCVLRAVAADERALTINKFSGLPLSCFAHVPTRPYLSHREAQRVNADRRRLSPVAE